MESIDRLRKWWRDRFPVTERQLGCEFREHVDAIEREVAERYMLLPLDAEGVSIHVGDGSMEWVTGPTHVWVLLDAADMLDENEQFRVTMGAVTSANECMDLLVAENAKLLGLAERAWKAAERLCQAFDGPCRDDGVTIDKPCPMGERDEECVYGQLQRELREHGVEVDG